MSPGPSCQSSLSVNMRISTGLLFHGSFQTLNLSCTPSFRRRNFVLMSVYMPWDDRSIYQHDEYIFTIGCIQAVVDAHPYCNFLFGGDWNLCKNGCYSTELCVRRFCTDNELCWIDTCTDHIDYTYHNDTNDHYSLIDHFICSANLIGEGDKSAIMVDGLNTSDHFAISLEINLHTLLGGLGSSAPSITKLRWDRANLQLYQSVCAQSLASLDLPLDALLCTERAKGIDCLGGSVV